MEDIKYKYFASPLGEIEIKFDSDFIYAVEFTDEGYLKKENSAQENHFIKTAELQLKDYFAGKLKNFEIPLQLNGTDFQNRVWKELTNIPFGKTISYLQLAKKLGDEKCIRAAASANGKNPFAILVPCHRVIGSDGTLTGYAGGLWRKQWLLEHEAKVAGTYQKLF